MKSLKLLRLRLSEIKKFLKGQTKASVKRKSLASEITGRVVWFNVSKWYRFIHCDNKEIDIFVHQTDIIKINLDKFFRSLT